jgi:hypothetical protein
VTNGEIVVETMRGLTVEQIGWCVEQARNCDIDPDAFDDLQVLSTYVRRYGAQELHSAADAAKLDCPS